MIDQKDLGVDIDGMCSRKGAIDLQVDLPRMASSKTLKPLKASGLMEDHLAAETSEKAVISKDNGDF
jgi:hypothetical protein